MPANLSSTVSVEQIDTTRDTGNSVFRAECGDASMTFIFPRTRPQDIWVHTVRSPERGGMKAMLDFICQEYGCESVRFMNTLNDAIRQRLDGATVVEMTIPEPHPAAGETIQCVDVEWSVGEVGE